MEKEAFNASAIAESGAPIEEFLKVLHEHKRSLIKKANTSLAADNKVGDIYKEAEETVKRIHDLRTQEEK